MIQLFALNFVVDESLVWMMHEAVGESSQGTNRDKTGPIGTLTSEVLVTNR